MPLLVRCNVKISKKQRGTDKACYCIFWRFQWKESNPSDGPAVYLPDTAGPRDEQGQVHLRLTIGQFVNL